MARAKRAGKEEIGAEYAVIGLPFVTGANPKAPLAVRSNLPFARLHAVICKTAVARVDLAGNTMIRAGIFAIFWGAGAVAADLPPPITDDDYRPVVAAEAKLGQLLFYDPILSGGRNIACSTCHHPRFGTSDGVSLGLGDGGIGLGPARTADPDNMPEQRIPRNAPALFNLGALEFKSMFADGRIEEDPTRPSGLRTPLDESMVVGFHSVLAAQAMFPVLSPDEMAGHYAESDVSIAVREGMLTVPGGAWDILSKRVAAIAKYRESFAAVYPEISAGRPIEFTDIANAMAAFIAFEWRADNAPFDAYLREGAPLPPEAEAGMALFYGPAGCATCHAGKFQTDHGFHAMADPQIGPGKAERFENHSRDTGRMRVTNQIEDAYAFRTPSLRNVTVTGPWGHAGAYRDLTAYLAHHIQPGRGMENYDLGQALLPVFQGLKDDLAIIKNPVDMAAIAMAAANAPTVDLTPEEIAQIIAFLESLRDQGAIEGRLGVPDAVPSGLPVDR
jgi:cytochrome c peroxidase